MKTLIIWIMLFVSLIGTIAFLLSQRNDAANKSTSDGDGKDVPKEPLTFDQAIVYTCARGAQIATAFETGTTERLELSLPNASPVLLTSTESASGAKYTNETGIVFWEKGGTAMVEQNNEVTYADCTPGAVSPEPVVSAATSQLIGTQWIWTETKFATGTPVTPNKPKDFILTFAEANRFSANTDCNNVGGGFVGGVDGALSFTEMVSTLMACEGDTKEADFVSQLSSVALYQIDGDTLTLAGDAKKGEMKFNRK